MPTLAERAKPLVRDEIERFVGDVQAYAEAGYDYTPTTTIFTSNTFRNRKYEFSVSQPSNIVRDTNRFNRSYFADLTQSLLDKGLSFCPQRPDVEETLLRKRLFEFAKLTLDYAGAFEFDTDAFESAYAMHFSSLYQSTHTHRVIFPLPQVILRSESPRTSFSVTLPPRQGYVDSGQYVATVTEDLRLSKILDEEMTAMQTHGTPGMITKQDQAQKRLGWTTKLEVELEVTHRPTKHNPDAVGLDLGWTGNRALHIAGNIAKQLVTALRLWEPTEYAGLGPGYLLRDSWKTYREISADVDRVLQPKFGQRSVQFQRSSVTLEEPDEDGFCEHWVNIGSYCAQDSQAETTLKQCLSRFNRMYERSAYEDQLLDAYLGFETTLIRGDPENVLSERGTVLLTDPSDSHIAETRAFFDGIRQVRNKVAHNDVTLSQSVLINHPGPDEPREFLDAVRKTLAQTVLAYIELLDGPTDSIQMVNQTVLSRRVDEQFRDERVN
ncbi:hypothetical protein [Halocatena halophila]|uniref:hypothetical protein n=1 Tax=Halocatena halophila TaxID=2814576 RepID=UPI002ED6ACE7